MIKINKEVAEEIKRNHKKSYDEGWAELEEQNKRDGKEITGEDLIAKEMKGGNN